MPFIASRNRFIKNPLHNHIQQLTQDSSRLGKWVANGIIIGAAIVSPELYAARIGIQDTSITVEEPNSGSTIVAITAIATFDDNATDWNNLTPCTISGTIGIKTSSGNMATQGEDYNLTEASFSMTSQPRPIGEGGIQTDSVSQDILFEILDDGNEEETTEYINYEITSYGVSCANDSSRSISLSNYYGSIIINDPFDVKTEVDAPITSEIPIRQKSLSSQLNSLRSLSLQAAETQNRSIAKELNRARQSNGFSAANLQVKVNGEYLPKVWTPGAAAGDTFEDFGRWGFFLSGSISTGSHREDLANPVDYDSSLLLAGIDYRLTDNLVLGSAFARSVVDAGKLEQAKTDFTRSSLSVFASYYSTDSFYVDAIISSGSSSYDLTRKILNGTDTQASASARTDGDESSAALGAGYNLHNQGKNLRIFSFINYIDANIDSYQERVNEDANAVEVSSAANVNDIDLQSLTADLGLELSWNINTNKGVYSPAISLAWEHQFADDAVDISGHFVDGSSDAEFNYHAPDRDNNYFNAQIGVNGVFRNGFSAFISYDTTFSREDFSSKQYSMGVRWQF